MKRLALFSFVFAALTLFSGAASGQLANDCTGAGLTGADVLPVSETVGSAGFSQDLDMSAGSCTELTSGMDTVVCFTPENSCNVNFTCDYVPSGTSMAANIFEGMCSDTPASCTATAANATGPAVISDFALSAGTNYCFQCESAVAAVSMFAEIAASSGDCGSLPVSLQSFEVNE